ncbi:hypothetical protein TrLO_g7446 [Triparma laevis f. longispina]|uniref:Protein HIRA n=1 Tax=Triparma laevis f. longispina TaxID=1714387 RepID=A0A9W7DVC2_9STRA|nr:hypothetical protein TrLO_g7446 [Triparma laevis f. longispina]
MVVVSLPLSIYHSPNPSSPTRSPIYTTSLHPTTSRLATGGGDGRLRIWSTTSIFTNPKSSNGVANTKPTGKWTDEGGYSSLSGEESSANPPNLLFSSPSSGSSVMSLRWSNNGNYLAVASDDSYITVYNLSSVPNTSVGFGGEEEVQNIENWSKKHVLRGHSLDCVSLAWSPNGNYLISCSLDSQNPVCVWDLASNDGSLVMQPFKTLGKMEHQGGCKGVAFDPQGAYFATTCDSPKLTVWSTKTWSPESTTTTTCFSTTSDLTMFRRISWTPDGSGIIASNSSINSKSCASILKRDNLDLVANLVGHKTVVCCTACNDSFFEHTGDGVDKYKMFIAVGDKRGYLTVWCNKVAKPIFKSQVSTKKLSITDLSWKEHTLVVSCLDGHVTAFKFDEKELGKVLSQEEKNKIMNDKYGSQDGIQNLDVMRLQQQMQKEAPVAAPRYAPIIPKQIPSPVKTPADTLRLQVRSKNKAGKKRIAPVLVSVSDQAVDLSRGDNPTGGSNSTTTTQIPSTNGTLNTTNPTAQPQPPPNQLAARKKPKTAPPTTAPPPPKNAVAPKTKPSTAPIPPPTQPNKPNPASSALPPCLPVPQKHKHTVGKFKIYPNPTPSTPSTPATSTLQISNRKFVFHGLCTCVAVLESKFVVLGNDLGELRVFSVDGDNVFLWKPVLMLGYPVCLVNFDKDVLIAANSMGSVRAWKLEENGGMKSVFKLNVRDIISKGMLTAVKIIGGKVIGTIGTPERGYGLIQHFYWEESAEAWFRLADGRFTGVSGTTTEIKRRRGEKVGVVEGFEDNTESTRPLAGRRMEGGISEKFEERIKVAEAFESDEADEWTKEWVAYLASQGDVEMVRAVCKNFGKEELQEVLKELVRHNGLEDLISELVALSEMK